MSMSPLETGGIPVFALAIGIRIKIPYCRYYGESLSLIHISEPTRRTPISYAVFCLKKKSMPSSA